MRFRSRAVDAIFDVLELVADVCALPGKLRRWVRRDTIPIPLTTRRPAPVTERIPKPPRVPRDLR